eukprot:1148986-Pelagomonas_calceolata.AAC.4
MCLRAEARAAAACSVASLPSVLSPSSPPCGVVEGGSPRPEHVGTKTDGRATRMKYQCLGVEARGPEGDGSTWAWEHRGQNRLAVVGRGGTEA